MSRHYQIDGKEYPSVTTVTGRAYDVGPAHAVWVAQFANHLAELVKTGEMYRQFRYVWDGRKQVLSYEDFNPLDVLSDFKWMKGQAFYKQQGAMDRGTIVNDFLDEFEMAQYREEEFIVNPEDASEWLNGKLEEGQLKDGFKEPVPYKTTPEETIPFLCSALKFMNDHKPRLLHGQVQVHNSKLGYAGTLDHLGVMGNERLFEWKTGQENRAHWMQVAAYRESDQVRGTDFIPTVVYFQKDSYRVCTFESNVMYRRYWAMFKRELDSYKCLKSETPWQTETRSSLDVFDYA